MYLSLSNVSNNPTGRVHRGGGYRPSSPAHPRFASKVNPALQVSPTRCREPRSISKCGRGEVEGECPSSPTAAKLNNHALEKQSGEKRSKPCDRDVLYDILRQSPVQLDPSSQECDDYIRDTAWPFAEIKKVNLLGRGGFSVVWLGTDPSNTRVAVKQVARRGQTYQGEIEAAKSEILIAEMLSQNDYRHRGHKYIAAILRAVETRRGIWMVQEYGGIPLSKLLFETTGVSHNGGRIYDVKHLPFLQLLQRDDHLLKKVLKQMLLALDLLAMNSIVHSDLKPENVLVGSSDDEELRVRICDLGSAFVFQEEKEQRPFATPEYMPPEALKANCSCLRMRSSMQKRHTEPKSHPWSFDIWSLGCIWLEILHGVPLWIPFDCRLPSRRIVKGGLFGVKRREPARILVNQEAVLKDLPTLWARAHRNSETGGEADGRSETGSRGSMCVNHPLNAGIHRTPSIMSTSSGFQNFERPPHNIRNPPTYPSSQKNSSAASGLTLIKRMLAVNPSQRIEPKDALSHPFLH